jgi:hypothetical protein
VLRRARRSATVTATTCTSLLVLDAHDLQVLMDREPLVAERIDAEVRRRLGRKLVKPDGGILPEELEGAEEERTRRAAPEPDATDSRPGRLRPVATNPGILESRRAFVISALLMRRY